MRIRTVWRTVQGAARLEWYDRALALQALGWLALGRGATALLPYNCARQWLARVARRGETGATANDCVRAIERMAWAVPGSTCLSRALAGACLLQRHGHTTSLALGVTTAGGAFRAHAWIEMDGTNRDRDPSGVYDVLLREPFTGR